MRRIGRLALVALLCAVVAAGALALSARPASAATRCPKGSHLVTCPTYSFCCPNNALCVCL